MKIISKYKDYYDYLTGIYGIDEKLVLDRREFTPSPAVFPHAPEIIRLFICGWEIEGLSYNDKFYYGEDLLQFSSGREAASWRRTEDYYEIKVDKAFIGRTTSYADILKYKIKDKHEFNKHLDCPILIEVGNSESIGIPYDKRSFAKFPILKEYNLASYIHANDIYLMLVEWLGKQEDIPDKRTNKEKIITNGFDTKTSFRNM